MTTLREALLMAINELENSTPHPREGNDDFLIIAHREHFAALAALQEELEKLGDEE